MPKPRPVVGNFQPRYTLHKPVTKEVAAKALAQLQKENARKMGDVPRAELENPKDASWVDKLDFAEEAIACPSLMRCGVHTNHS